MTDTKQSSQEKPEYLSQSKIIDRGWTAAGIKKFLGEPDDTAQNPYYRNASPTKLYDITRIEQAEETEEFQQWKEKSEKRKQASKKAAQKKKQKTLEKVESRLHTVRLKKKYKNLTPEQLENKAIRHYDNLQEMRAMERGHWDFSPVSDPTEEFIQRISVNYLRHEGTTYDNELEQYFNHVGVLEAQDMVREKVYDVIAQHYPYLKEECGRQLARRRGEIA